MRPNPDEKGPELVSSGPFVPHIYEGIDAHGRYSM